MTTANAGRCQISAQREILGVPRPTYCSMRRRGEKSERRGLCVSRRACVCLLSGLCSREIVGHAAGGRKDAGPTKSAFATAAFPLTDIQAFHADRGSESGSTAIDGLLGASGTERSLPRKSCPYDSAVDEPTKKMLKAEFVYGESFPRLHELQVKLSDYVRWYSHFMLHSRLGYVSPVEFRNAGLSL